MRKTLVALFVMFAMLMSVSQASAAVKHKNTGIATLAQIQAEISLVDPNHTIDWRMSITNGYQSGTEFGVALPWYGIVMLQADALPTAGDLYKGIIVHEWSHVLQYRWVRSTPQNFYLLEQKTDIELMADCMARIQTGVNYFEDCYLVPRQNLARTALADLASGKTYNPTVKRLHN